MFKTENEGCQLLPSDAISDLTFIECSGCISNCSELPLLFLLEHCPGCPVAGIDIQHEHAVFCTHGQYWACHEIIFQLLEGLLPGICPDKGFFFSGELMQWCCQEREVLHKFSVVRT